MNTTTTTEAQKEISGSEITDSMSGQAKGSQPKPGLGELWLAILAVVAVVALGAAVALGAFDSSSEAKSVDTISALDPRADADFHRTPAIQGLDSDYFRETNQHASKAVESVVAVDPRLDADFHREPNQPAPEAEVTPPYVNSGLDADTQREINQQYSKAAPSVDPRLDADHHRETSND